MEVVIDHYFVLGLPSGEEGSRLTDIEIIKAYKSKALKLHPDKRPYEPNAKTEFQILKSSYEILKDEKARKNFDNDLRNHRQRQSQYDAKRQKMMSDLHVREERASFPTSKAREEEEERIVMKLKEEIAAIKAMQSKSTKDGAVAAMKGLFGHQFTTVSPANKYEEEERIDEPKLNDLVGAGYQAKEDSILQKLLKKAAEKHK